MNGVGNLLGTDDSLGSVRPKMLHDTIFLRSKDGVFFRSRGRAFRLRGSGVYNMVSRLAPHLLGELTVNEICQQFEPHMGKGIRKLIVVLLERHVVINHVEEISELGQAVLNEFRPQINFIEHFSGLPVGGFTRFRASRVFLTGSGIPLRSLVLSLIQNGLETIILDERASELEGDAEIAAADFRSRGINVQFERMALTEVLSSKSEGLTAICHVSDVSDLGQVLAINEYCCKQSTLFIPGLLLGGRAFVGPLVRRDKPGCWLCFLLRHCAVIEPLVESMVWKHVALGSPWHNEWQSPCSPSLKILGNLVGFELFRLLVQHIPPEAEHSVLSIDLETLESCTSPLLAHPLCPHCADPKAPSDLNVTADDRDDKSAENPDLDGNLRVLSKLVDAQCGIAKRFQDDEREQAPLFRSTLVMSRYSGAPELAVPGYSINSNARARLDAIINGVGSYVSSIVDTRRMWNGTQREAAQAGLSPIADPDLAGWIGGITTGDDETMPWLHARSLLNPHATNLVPAAAVYTQSALNANRFERINVGTGVGFRFKESCRRAVFSLFAHEVLKRIAKREALLTEVTLSSLSTLGADTRYLINAFKHLNQKFRLLAFMEPDCGCVALALCSNELLDSKRVAVGSADSLAQASNAAMTELLAIRSGSESQHTVEDYLPRSLGYVLDLSTQPSSSKQCDLEQYCGNRSVVSVLPAFGGSFTDILVINTTTSDVASCGIVAIKALFAKRLNQNPEPALN